MDKSAVVKSIDYESYAYSNPIKVAYIFEVTSKPVPLDGRAVVLLSRSQCAEM